MSKADCHRDKAGRCTQVCKDLGWVPPTITCHIQVHTSRHTLGWLLPQIIFCSFGKGWVPLALRL